MDRPTPLIVLLAGALAAAPQAARAERLTFAAGGVICLPVAVEGDLVRVEAPGGAYVFHRDDFREIAPGHWPAQEWPSRKEHALGAGAAEKYAASRWALDRGLVDDAVAMLRAAHADDPRHQPTARMVAALDRLEAPCSDADPGPIRRVLGGTFDVAVGPHVVVFHQHSEAEARRRVALLEDVIRAYYLEFASLGIELTPPAQRLPSAWYADRADYLAFLRREGADAFLTTRGYHHPTRRLVVTYDSRSDEDQRRGRADLDARRRRLPTGPDADRLRRDLDRRQLLLDQNRLRLDLGTAAHELVHQLAVASRLVREEADIPLWFQEGLAMQFEATRGDRWAGLASAPAVRVADWRSIRPSPRLAPLLRDAGFGHGYRREPYAQAWALVHFLRRAHPAEFVGLLDRLRVPAPSDPARDGRAYEAIRELFGDDLARVERDWHAFIDGCSDN